MSNKNDCCDDATKDYGSMVLVIFTICDIASFRSITTIYLQ